MCEFAVVYVLQSLTVGGRVGDASQTIQFSLQQSQSISSDAHDDDMCICHATSLVKSLLGACETNECKRIGPFTAKEKKHFEIDALAFT